MLPRACKFWLKSCGSIVEISKVSMHSWELRLWDISVVCCYSSSTHSHSDISKVSSMTYIRVLSYSFTAEIYIQTVSNKRWCDTDLLHCNISAKHLAYSERSYPCYYNYIYFGSAFTMKRITVTLNLKSNRVYCQLYQHFQTT